jgi:hypothetical protein
MKHALMVLSVWLMSSSVSFSQTNNAGDYAAGNNRLVAAERPMTKAGTSTGNVVNFQATIAKVDPVPAGKTADAQTLKAHTEALLANTRAIQAYTEALQANTRTVQEKTKALQGYTAALEANTRSAQEKTKALQAYTVALKTKGNATQQSVAFKPSRVQRPAALTNAPPKKATRPVYIAAKASTPVVPVVLASAKVSPKANVAPLKAANVSKPIAAVHAKVAVKHQSAPAITLAKTAMPSKMAVVALPAKKYIPGNMRVESCSASRLMLGETAYRSRAKKHKYSSCAEYMPVAAVSIKASPKQDPAPVLVKAPAKKQTPATTVVAAKIAAPRAKAKMPSIPALAAAPVKAAKPIVANRPQKQIKLQPAPIIKMAKAPVKASAPLVVVPAKKHTKMQPAVRLAKAPTKKQKQSLAVKAPAKQYEFGTNMKITSARTDMPAATTSKLTTKYKLPLPVGPGTALVKNNAEAQKRLAAMASKQFASAKLMIEAPAKSQMSFMPLPDLPGKLYDFTANMLAAPRTAGKPAPKMNALNTKAVTSAKAQLYAASSHARLTANTALKNESAKNGKSMSLNQLLQLPVLTKYNSRATVKNKHAAVKFGLEEGDLITTTGYVQVVATENAGKKNEVYYVQLTTGTSRIAPCFIIKITADQFASMASKKSADKAKKFIRERLVEGRVPCAGGNIMRHPVYVSITGVLAYNTARAAEMKGSHPVYQCKRSMRTGTPWELSRLSKIEFSMP